MGVPIRFPITTTRLTIRPMRLDDAEALLAVYGDVETMQHLNSELPATVDEAREWVQTKIDLFERDDQLSLWTVIHTESGQIVGDVGLQHEDYGSGPVVGIGGRGNRHFWRQGMGFEAASATIDAGFEQLELAVIGAETRPENRPAQALLSKLGHATGRDEYRRMASLFDHSRGVAGPAQLLACQTLHSRNRSPTTTSNADVVLLATGWWIKSAIPRRALVPPSDPHPAA